MEDKFKTYLGEKETFRLSGDFDKSMMILIHKRAISKSTDKKYFRLMYLFFAIGLILGFTIAISFVDLEFTNSGNKLADYRMLLLFPLIGILLFLFEKIYQATMVKIEKEKFSSI